MNHIICNKHIITAAVAGTFDKLHLGHRMLLDIAFSLANYVIIGVMDDSVLKNKIVSSTIDDFNSRVSLIKKYINHLLKKLRKECSYKIIPIKGAYDFILDYNDIDYFIVSEETLQKAIKINELRANKGLKRLTIIAVPLILTEDNRPISSHRIRLEEINCDGELLAECKVLHT